MPAIKKRGAVMELIFDKKEGSAAIVESMFATLLTVMVVITLVISYAAWQTQLERNYEIDLVMHKYLMEMEMADYSDQMAINGIFDALENELEEKHNMTGISFSGSSVTPVNSGAKITLHVTGSMTQALVEMPGGLAGSILKRQTVTVDITKTGTAMY